MLLLINKMIFFKSKKHFTTVTPWSLLFIIWTRKLASNEDQDLPNLKGLFGRVYFFLFPSRDSDDLARNLDISMP